MEMRQQNGRAVVLRQAKDLAKKAHELNKDNDKLDLKGDFEVPKYLKHVDNHLMPGSYHTEYFEGDVANAANYDSGITTNTISLFQYIMKIKQKALLFYFIFLLKIHKVVVI